MDICFALALSSVVLLRVPAPLTLAWEHSVEHFRLEEEYTVRGGALVLTDVRTQGVGAGVDVPAEARRIGDGWRFTPALPPQGAVQLANSAAVKGYALCHAGRCAPLDAWLGGVREPLVMRPC